MLLRQLRAKRHDDRNHFADRKGDAGGPPAIHFGTQRRPRIDLRIGDEFGKTLSAQHAGRTIRRLPRRGNPSHMDFRQMSSKLERVAGIHLRLNWKLL
jgi:hypothetical protein